MSDHPYRSPHQKREARRTHHLTMRGVIEVVAGVVLVTAVCQIVVWIATLLFKAFLV